ncbi:MAG: phosphoglucosamine mutase [Alphaproteobacteria bacterium]|nr:phosphoglucosamine mutase [Alphaproteobacteria bacterium]
MTKRYFGTDGIRGRANTPPMTAQFALQVAMATAIVLRAQRAGDQTDRVIIGKDTRLSGYMLEEAMCAGFVSMGMNVILSGPIPTPGIAMLTRSLRADAGVMISASHNHFQDNGIKLFGADGHKLDDALEVEIENLLERDLTEFLAAPDALGKASRLDDALGRYAEYIKSGFRLGGGKKQSLEGLKIVVDCAHGAAYKVAPQVLWELEAEVSAIGVSPNGRNINDGYGATAPAKLQKAVVDQGADIGIALDGDADRLIVVDEQGRVVDGDQLMGALALSMKAQGILRENALVSTVMSNLGLERMLGKNGIALIRTPVGDRHVSEAMRARGCNLGGEQSGHIVLSDYSTTGDGLLAALQILALIRESGQPASAVLNVFAPLPQILRNVRFEGGRPLEDDQVKAAIRKAEDALSGDGRLLVRPSGTEAVIRVMAEGGDSALIERVVDELCGTISHTMAEANRA